MRWCKYLKIAILCAFTVISIKVLLNNEKFLNIFAYYYFDKNYYITQYPEVKNTKLTPFKHYVKKGWKEGKNPNASFSTIFHTNIYRYDNCKLNPLAYYIKTKLRFENSYYTSSSALKVELLKNPKYYISLAAIFQNEARFLKEWIEFYLNLGVEHFYLYNHLSTDNYMEVLDPYIKRGLVDLKDIKEKPNNIIEWNGLQTSIYTKISQEVQDITEWLIFVDTDEFLFPIKENSLKEILTKYDKYATVSINWRIFGSSSVERISEDKLMIESLTKSDTSQDFHVKSIVKPRYVRYFSNPHFPLLKPGYFQVTENFEPFKGPFLPSESRNILRINHYWARDLEFYRKYKLSRVHLKNMTKQCEEHKNNINLKLSIKYDDSILKFVKDIRKRMFIESR